MTQGAEPGAVQLAVLAVVQGVTEFLPVSSSAHLILTSELLGWPDQGLAFDIALHAGALLALCVYLRREIRAMLAGLTPGCGPLHRQGRQLLKLCIVGSLPLAIVGLLARDWAEAALRTSSVIALANLLFAALLWRGWVRRDSGGRTLQQVSLRQALYVGAWQCMAVIPGASRSGVALTGALLTGIRTADAVRLSFLLALPAISGSVLLEILRWSPAASVNAAQAVAGALIAGLTAWATLRLLLGWIQRAGVLPFVLYRMALGAVLVIWLLAPVSAR